MVEKSEGGIDSALFGGNPSAEEEEEALEDGGVQKGLDIMLHQGCQDENEHGIADKKALMSYFKRYCKKWVH